MGASFRLPLGNCTESCSPLLLSTPNLRCNPFCGSDPPYACSPDAKGNATGIASPLTAIIADRSRPFCAGTMITGGPRPRLACRLPGVGRPRPLPLRLGRLWPVLSYPSFSIACRGSREHPRFLDIHLGSRASRPARGAEHWRQSETCREFGIHPGRRVQFRLGVESRTPLVKAKQKPSHIPEHPSKRLSH